MPRFSRATVEDAAALLDLQRLAYQSEAELYDDFTIPPLTQTIEEMREDLRTQIVLKAELDHALVASARACLKDGSVYIGRVIVHPRFQGKGLGKRTMAAIEAEFPGAKRFELFTGDRSLRNLGFYRGLGYREFATRPLSPTIRFVFMEKHVG